MIQIHRLEFIRQVSALILWHNLPLGSDGKMSPKGIIVRQSKFKVKQTIDQLAVILQAHGATVYVRIDQQAELKKVGEKIPPLEFLLFGNPRGGGPIMAENPLAALDLPLKVIAWEDGKANSWIAYNDAAYIRGRYDLPAALVSPLAFDHLLKSLIK